MSPSIDAVLFFFHSVFILNCIYLHITLRPEHKHGHLAWTISFSNTFCSNNICIVGQFLLSYKRIVKKQFSINEKCISWLRVKSAISHYSKHWPPKKNNSASLWEKVISWFFQYHRNWMQNLETPCCVYVLLWYEMDNCFQIYENVETIM